MTKKRAFQKFNRIIKKNPANNAASDDKPMYYQEKVPGENRFIIKKVTPDMDMSNMVEMTAPDFVEVCKKPGEEGTYLIRPVGGTGKPMEITGDIEGVIPEETRRALDELEKRNAAKTRNPTQARELLKAAAPLEKKVYTISRDEMLKLMGKRLAAVREHLGLYHGKMAEELCVSRAHYYRLERGETAPHALVLKNLSAVFDVSMEWFFTGKGVMIRSLAKQSSQEWDFGRDEKFVQKMLEKMYKIPPLRYAILSFFDEYYVKNKEFFDKVLGEYERFHDKYKEEAERQPEARAILSVTREGGKK